MDRNWFLSHTGKKSLLRLQTFCSDDDLDTSTNNQHEAYQDVSSPIFQQEFENFDKGKKSIQNVLCIHYTLMYSTLETDSFWNIKKGPKI